MGDLDDTRGEANPGNYFSALSLRRTYSEFCVRSPRVACPPSIACSFSLLLRLSLAEICDSAYVLHTKV